MANMLHGSTRTTPRIRAELQRSKEKTSVLAKRYGLSRTTVTKWRLRTTTADAVRTPQHAHHLTGWKTAFCSGVKADSGMRELRGLSRPLKYLKAKPTGFRPQSII